MSRADGGFVVLVHLTVKAQHQAHFQAAILENAAQSLANEPGCWVFDVAANASGSEVCLYEVYQDSGSFDAHLKTEHFLAFDRLNQLWLEGKTVQTFVRLKG